MAAAGEELGGWNGHLCVFRGCDRARSGVWVREVARGVFRYDEAGGGFEGAELSLQPFEGVDVVT